MARTKYSFFPVMLLVLLLASCKSGNTIIIDDGFNRKEIKYSGDISFNDDETAIESITSGGYLEFRSNERKLIAENNYHGGVDYEMYRNGKRVYEDEAAGQKFLAEAIDQMISMGFNAQKRLEKLYRKGGNPALLRAAVKANSNHLKQSYVDYILTHGNPDDDDLVDIAKIVTFKIDGTFEKAQILKKYTSGAFSNPEVSAAWFEAIESIDSDFEKANTLKAILNQPLTEDQYRRLIIVSNTITSDFEQCNFLKEIIEKENLPRDRESFSVLLQSLHNVESGFEKSGILKKVLDKGLHTEEQWYLFLKEVALINEDFEKANILTAAAAKMPGTTDLTEIYTESAKTISSEYEYGRALKAIQEIKESNRK
ncbi:MAG: hypothetical protein QM768_22900 [Agriterribacter sp.]